MDVNNPLLREEYDLSDGERNASALGETAENPIETESEQPPAAAAPVIHRGATLTWKPPTKTRKRKNGNPPKLKRVNPPRANKKQNTEPAAEGSEPEQTVQEVDSNKAVDSEIVDLKQNRRSWVWKHFDLEKAGDDIVAFCIYCGRDYMAGGKIHGTGNLITHLTKQCNIYLGMQSDSKQQTLIFPKKEGAVATYSYENSRLKLVRMIVIDEFPFAVVEYEGFVEFVHSLQPRFNLPSRVTVSRDVMKLFLEEKKKVMSLIKSERVCLTTDTWTSLTNLTYMCVTGHWINKDWKLHKRILCFRVVPNHKGKTMGKMLENRLLVWGIDKLLTVTLDNASANDGAIDYVRKNTKGWKGTILDHEFLHMRCCAHILNLIVKAGLEHQSLSVVKIRNAVRYVRSSPSRLDAFKKCAAAVKIESKSLLCLDIETRWNSTYKMLETALKFENAFERLSDEDAEYRAYFLGDGMEDDGDNLESETAVKKSKKKPGPPLALDWEAAKVFVKFLKLFYDITLKFSGTLNVTSNLFFKELVAVQTSLQNLSKQNDLNVSLMAMKMKEKFSKYWENLGKLNFLLYVAVILDPRYKMKFVKWCLDQVYDATENERTSSAVMFEEVKQSFNRLYDYYAKCGDAKACETQQPSSSNTDTTVDIDTLGASLELTSQFANYLEATESCENKCEIDKYLEAKCVKECASFDLLDWWKTNCEEYPVLSQMARDVLAVPVSTVASESTFSTGGRILSPYRSSLNPEMVEALVCCQNWLRSNHGAFDVQDSMKEVPSDEAEKYAEIVREFREFESSRDK